MQPCEEFDGKKTVCNEKFGGFNQRAALSNTRIGSRIVRRNPHGLARKELYCVPQIRIGVIRLWNVKQISPQRIAWQERVVGIPKIHIERQRNCTHAALYRAIRDTARYKTLSRAASARDRCQHGPCKGFKQISQTIKV